MKVFISYAEKDSPIAVALARALRLAGREVTGLSDEILPGDNWGEAMAKGLETSDAMVTLVSPASVKSVRVEKDIEFALNQPRYADRLIPVMIEKDIAIPLILKNLDMVDATSASRPKLVNEVEARLGLKPVKKSA